MYSFGIRRLAASVLTLATVLTSGLASTSTATADPKPQCAGSTGITVEVGEDITEVGEDFTVEVAIKNLATGFFSDPVNDYYEIPQVLGDDQIIQGAVCLAIE